MRLIDAKALEMQTKEAFKGNPVVMGMLLRWIRKQPTVDAAPVVRCRDCVHWFGRDGGSPVCLKIYEDGAVSADAWQTREADDFCSDGEREVGDTDG